ncbi:uncharacterized protein LOC110455985 [Mizuhopecten yessoensis]|uniref:Uncharacterized protein n=1 Tax=Mizuhopecten yessoensis TaxID=6573 RepID=A0A210QBY5_MIZYE|nr:uncharacterized protein LOC110455985 [Mizuhopecten yessoensis]OWF46244.1 hypothetical protein KP79_PYT15464 [Mizuhopecten yessoensis]
MFRVTLLFVAAFLAVKVKSENCHYQFTVPDSSGIKCNGEDSSQMKYSIDHINSELVIAERRQQAMSEALSREMSKLDTGVESIRNVSTRFRMDLQEIQTKVSSMAALSEEVKGLRDMVTNSKESLEPKFSALQEQMMGIVERIQNESSKLTDHAQAMILSHTTQLMHQAQSIISLKRETDDLKVQNAGQAEILAYLSKRIQAEESATNADPPLPSQVHSIKSSVNLLRSTFTMGYRNNKREIETLKRQIAAMSATKPSVSESPQEELGSR